MSLPRVSRILWRERELLELLVRTLEEERLLLATGRARWLAFASREVELVLAEIGRSELDRAVEVDGVAEQLRLPADVSLRELAESVPAPWDVILEEHRTALLALSDEISALAATDRDLSGAGSCAAPDTVLLLDAEPCTDTPRGPLLVQQAT